MKYLAAAKLQNVNFLQFDTNFWFNKYFTKIKNNYFLKKIQTFTL